MSQPPLPSDMRFEQGSGKRTSRRTRSKPEEPIVQRTRLVNWLIAMGFLALISGLTVLYVRERQRTLKTTTIKTGINKTGALREISKTKEAAFEEIKLNKAEITLTDIELFDDAVKALEQYIDAEPGDIEQVRRMEELRRRQHVIHAERLRAISKKAEASSRQEDAVEAGVAQRELIIALEAEKEIDQKWYFSGMVDKGKITQLDTRIRRLEAEPIWKKTRALEAQAEAFFKKQQLAEAEDCLKESIRLEADFTEKYRDVLNTEFNRVDKLNARLETIRSSPLQLVLETTQKQANEAEALNDWSKAANLWEDTLRQISKIINQYPLSAYADRKKETELVRRRNLARSHPEGEGIQAEAVEMRQLLQRGQIDSALTKARSLQTRMVKIEMNNPGAFAVDSPLVQEVEYITKHEGSMRVLLSLLDRLILPIPGEPNKRMLKHEVAQSLYSLVVGKNPSAVVRGTAPAESVSYDDAVQFCRQISWLTGRSVRLPRLAEIQLAAGNLSALPARAQAWTFDSTDGLTVMDVATSQPNSIGFYDILGNVEEWVESAPNTSVATVVGGNVNWVPTTGLPQRQIQKKERSRTLGFRFVIE